MPSSKKFDTPVELLQHMAQISAEKLRFELRNDSYSALPVKITSFAIEDGTVCIKYSYSVLFVPVNGTFTGTLDEATVTGKYSEVGGLVSGNANFEVFLDGHYIEGEFFVGDKTIDGQTWKVSLRENFV